MSTPRNRDLHSKVPEAALHFGISMTQATEAIRKFGKAITNQIPMQLFEEEEEVEMPNDKPKILTRKVTL